MAAVKDIHVHRYSIVIFSFGTIHPAGDVTRDFEVPGKVTVKIGDSENR